MTSDDNNPRSWLIDAAIARYLEAVEQGAPLEQEAFLAQHADIADELRQFLADYSLFERQAPRAGSGNDATTDLSDDSARRKTVVNGAPLEVLRYFGDYELVEEIARGGMGVVYKARQTTLGRTVAVKMILAGQLASQAEVDRFYAEAQSAATLDHPHIVPIFEVGRHQGQHYFSMGYVTGESLAQRLAAGPLPPVEAVRIIRDVALAVHYAHGKGVIHRDLKPANVMLDADGHPRITDFGLAKQQTDTSGLTATGQVMGTPSYMPPEQVSGNNGQIGPASDVYSLGATLYSLLAGRPPFQAASAIDTLKQVLEKEPAPLRELDASVPRDLETITLKCLEKSPDRRYASAQVLADELDRFLTGRPILARPVSRVERAWRWCRRNPVVAALSSAAASLLLIIAIVSTLGYRREAELRTDVETQSQARATALAAETEARSAEKQQRLAAERQTRVADATRLAAQAREHLQEHPQRSLLLAREAVLATLQHDEPVLPVVEETLHAVTQQAGGIPLSGHTAPVGPIAVTADSHYLATGGADYTIRIWDLTQPDPSDSPKILQLAPNLKDPTHQDLWSLATSPDSRWIVASGNFEKTGPYVWDLQADEPHNTLRIGQFPVSVSGAHFSPDGRWLVCVSTSALKMQILLYRLDRDSNAVEKVIFPDQEFPFQGARIELEGQMFGTLKMSRAGSWLLAATSHKSPARNLDASQKPVASPADIKKLRVWDIDAPDPVTTERVIARTSDAEKDLPQTEFSPDGRWLLLQRSGPAMREPSVRLHDLQASADAEPRIVSAESPIKSTAFSPDGRWLATGHADLSVRLWDLRSEGSEFHSSNIGSGRLQGSVFAVKFTPNGKRLFGGGRMWDMTKDLEKIPASGRWIDSTNQLIGSKPEFSPDSHWLFDSSDLVASRGVSSNEIRVWDISKGIARPPFSLRGHEDLMRLGGISPDGRWMISTPVNLNYFPLHEQSGIMGNGTITRESSGERARRLNVDLNPRLWNLQTLGQGTDRQIIDSWPIFSFGSLSVSRDGNWLVAGSFGTGVDGAFLWNLQDLAKRSIWNFQDSVMPKSGAKGTGIPVDEIRGNRSWLPDAQRYKVAISPDGHWAATGGQTKNVCLFDLTALEPTKDFRPLSGHADGISALAFSPDSRILASGSRDHTVRIWKLHPAEQPAVGAKLAGHRSVVSTLAFSPDGRYLATGSRGPEILVFDLSAENTATSPVVLQGHDREITCLSFSPNGRFLVSGSGDQTVRAWDMANGDPNQHGIILSKQASPITYLAFSSEGRWLCAGGCLWDCTVPDWQTKPALQLSDLPDGVGAIAFSPDGRLLATAAWANSVNAFLPSDGTIQLWRLDNTSSLPQPIILHGHRSGILALTISADGKKLYSSSADGTTREWALDIAELLGQVRRTAGRDFTSDERRTFGIVAPSQGAVSATAEKPAPVSQLPIVHAELWHNSGVADVDFGKRWDGNRSEVARRLKLRTFEFGPDLPSIIPAQFWHGSADYLDTLQRRHKGYDVIFRNSGRPTAILYLELAPNPAEHKEKVFGHPVVCYRLAALADGPVRLQLLNEKTNWELDLHAPRWQPTGIDCDLSRFSGNEAAAQEDFMSRVSVHRHDNSGDHKLLVHAKIGCFPYTDPDLGVLSGAIFPHVLVEPASVRTDAYFVAELRKQTDGTTQWHIALLRNCPDELWAEINGQEVYRLPAIKEKEPSAFPMRVEEF